MAFRGLKPAQLAKAWAYVNTHRVKIDADAALAAHAEA